MLAKERSKIPCSSELTVDSICISSHLDPYPATLALYQGLALVEVQPHVNGQTIRRSCPSEVSQYPRSDVALTCFDGFLNMSLHGLSKKLHQESLEPKSHLALTYYTWSDMLSVSSFPRKWEIGQETCHLCASTCWRQVQTSGNRPPQGSIERLVLVIDVIQIPAL